MIHNPLYNIYIASCTNGGGIYQYHLYDDGCLKLRNFTQMDSPMYMASENNSMYILLRSPFSESKESGLVVCGISTDGKLQAPTGIISTKGEVACHLSVNCEDVYCANYISGSVIKMPEKLIKHEGKGINPIRQEAPHAHYVGFTPDKEFVCVVDLGLDTVFLYNKNLEFINKVQVPQGHGARHLVFSDNGKYCFVANELKSTVSILEYKIGELKYVDTVSCLPEGYAGETTASAIRFNEDHIYVSNRGLDTISVLKNQNGKLVYKDTYSCNGNFPRDFDIVGNYIICTNEKSDSITVLDKNFNVVYIESNVKSPICVISRDA